MQRTRNKKLVEAALMIALATVLSILKLVDLPYGGSVTMASMLPILILSYRNGLGWGLGGALVYAVIQQLLGLKTLSYFTTPDSVIAIILLDYIIAFTVVGLGGIFKRVTKKQTTAIVLGAVCTCLLRYICHVISGATLWVGLSIPDSAALLYSLGYNATYMLPETIVLAAVGYYVCSLIDFNKEVPSRAVRHAEEKASLPLYSISIGMLVLGTVVDILLISPHLQDPDTGEFTFALLGEVNWIEVSIVSILAVACAAAVIIYSRVKKSKQAEA